MIFNAKMKVPVILSGALFVGAVALAQGGFPAHPEPTTAVVRYQVADAKRSLEFYTHNLGFKSQQEAAASNSPIAIVARGNLNLLLSGPGTSGARPMPDGKKQSPGGWNRIVLYVDNLNAEIEKLRKAGVHFRNKVEAGPGGSQILIEDPDGNPIELHEAPKG